MYISIKMDYLLQECMEYLLQECMERGVTSQICPSNTP